MNDRKVSWSLDTRGHPSTGGTATAMFKAAEGSGARDPFRFSFQPFPLQLLSELLEGRHSRAECKGLTRYEKKKHPWYPRRENSLRGVPQKRAKRRELPFCCVVKRIQCTTTRINANAKLTKERGRGRRRKRRRIERKRDIYKEGKHGRVVGIKGKLLSYFHSRSLEFKSDTSAHHPARPTFFMILPRHFSAGGFVWRLKARRMLVTE